jgi:hypothetical protein
MSKTRAFVLSILALAFALASQDKVEVKTIDGVPHVLNPAKPLHGTIALEVERTRTIDPYQQPDVGLRMILFSRDDAGNVILFDPNRAEAHRFGPADDYLGRLTKEGQGPGEFGPMSGYQPYFADPYIVVLGGQKIALFDGAGKLVWDKTMMTRYEEGIDGSHFLSRVVSWTEKRDQVQTLKLVGFTKEGEKSSVDLFQAVNVGMIRNPSGQGGFMEMWATPNIFSAADAAGKRVFCGLNTDYKIWVKDLDGKDLRVIEKEHKNVKAGRAAAEKVLTWAREKEETKWMLDAYPDRFVAVYGLAPLPRGHLAVFRVTGAKKYEIDVFDPEGRCLYALVPPPGVKMDQAAFFATGFATIEEDGDYQVYREYRVKNLPGIFGK